MKNVCVSRIAGFLTVLILLSFFANPVSAATRNYNIKVVRDHNGARALALMVNDLRTNDPWYWDANKNKVYPQLSALEYDYALEEIAMQRAAELVFKYDVYRPDGSAFNSLTFKSSNRNGNSYSNTSRQSRRNSNSN